MVLPVLGTVLDLAKAVYFLLGGFVGLSVIFFFIRWWDSRRLKRQLARMESLLELINGKLEKLIARKPARKK